MGLISRVSSRTYRYIMAETFKPNLTINAKDHLIGRLCATVAKELLRGNNVTLVRCESIIITGNFYRNKLIMLEKLNKRTATNPKDGPFHYRAPCMMLKRMIRGMLPNRTGRGTKALARLSVFDGCPPPFDKQKRFKIPAAMKVIRSRPGRKVAVLGRLCSEVGWQYGDVVERLEAKRIANAEQWYATKQEKAAKRAKAVASVANKTKAIDNELAAMGY